MFIIAVAFVEFVVVRACCGEAYVCCVLFVFDLVFWRGFIAAFGV